MTTETVSHIRTAIASEAYRDALKLWNGYAAELADRIRQGTLPESAIVEAGDLLAWSRTVLRCALAHAFDQLNALHAVEVYRAQVKPEPHLIHTSF
jgi:hypothetical protein